MNKKKNTQYFPSVNQEQYINLSGKSAAAALYMLSVDLRSVS